ncbi:hypothetical protein DE146DRAFT_41274 [Phaeosphaeria sp. MPI-PUGE-AT-0046c]|nr:hypothetical protein DE146DRAFT_41274 [Phaeosphaeria sp. MPI-PUGE-AT-0046c]
MWRILVHLAILFSRHIHAYVDDRTSGWFSSKPSDSRNGSFLSPRSYGTIYPPGSKMTITWNSTSFDLKLILYQRNATGRDSSSSYIPDPQAQDEGRYVWTVDGTWDDSTSPYVLRGLDASADEGYQVNDFWTPMFYIGATEWASSTRMSASTSTSSRSSTRTQSIGMLGISTTVATPTWTSRSVTTWPAEATADSSIGDTDSSGGKTWDRKPGDLSESAAGTLMVVITLAFIGLLLCLITMFFNRLQRKEEEKRKMVSVNTSEDELMSGGAQGYARVPNEMEVSPVEMEVSPTELEISPVEMEGTRTYAEMDARREAPRVADLDELVV